MKLPRYVREKCMTLRMRKLIPPCHSISVPPHTSLEKQVILILYQLLIFHILGTGDGILFTFCEQITYVTRSPLQVDFRVNLFSQAGSWLSSDGEGQNLSPLILQRIHSFLSQLTQCTHAIYNVSI